MGIKAILKEFKKRQDAEAQKSLVYSQNETDTGKIWIDGKKIYRKVILLPALQEGARHRIDISNLKASAYIQLYGFIRDIQDRYIPILASDTDSAVFNVFARIENNELLFITGSERSIKDGFVILEYTKTTN